MSAQEYTSASKNYWQKHSDELGSDLNWNTFNKIWMAALEHIVCVTCSGSGVSAIAGQPLTICPDCKGQGTVSAETLLSKKASEDTNTNKSTT